MLGMLAFSDHSRSVAPATQTPQTPSARATTRRSVGALVLREMTTTYGRSPGGWLWAILEPIAAIALLSFAFSLAFKSPPLGQSFALFYATGFLPYMMFHDTSQKTALGLRFSKPLLSFSRVKLTDALFARFALAFLINLAVFVVVIAGLIVWQAPNMRPEPASVAIALAMSAGLGLACGFLNCFLFTSFPAWERLWNIGLRPLFIVSGVVFLLEDVPANLQPYLQINPLFHVTGMMRAAMYPTYQPDYLSVSYVSVILIFLMVLGLLLIDQNSGEMIEK